jgi:hypothetical protein
MNLTAEHAEDAEVEKFKVPTLNLEPSNLERLFSALFAISAVNL